MMRIAPPPEATRAGAVMGPRVLLSKPAHALLWFWLLLGAVLLIPNPLRSRLTSADEEVGPASAVPGAPNQMPGLPAPVTERPGADQVAAAPEPASGGAPAKPSSPKVEPIQDPHGSMASFYRALRRTAADKPGAVTRVLHYGDSLIDLDRITGELRHRLQKRYGDGGHGFVLAAKPWRWYNHPGVALADRGGWKRLRLIGGRPVGDGRLGLGCAAIQLSGGSASVYASTSIKSSRLQVYYLRQPRGGTLTVRVDGNQVAELETQGPRRESAVHEVKLEDAKHRIHLRARGRVRVFGMALERPGPGITWENLALVSVRFNDLARLDLDHWGRQLKFRQPHLVLFQFGANDTINFGGDIERYGKQVEKVLDVVRKAQPKASCMVIGPLDRLQRDRRGRLRSPGVVRRVADEQREAAHAAGCAFWDGQQAMGGPGAMREWMKRDLVLKDMVHLNPDGSRRFAGLLESALMQSLRTSRQDASGGAAD